MYQPPPIIAELLEDYFAAETALDEGSDTVLFRGQPVTSETLFAHLTEEVTKLGIDEDEMGVAFTHFYNMPLA